MPRRKIMLALCRLHCQCSKHCAFFFKYEYFTVSEIGSLHLTIFSLIPMNWNISLFVWGQIEKQADFMINVEIGNCEASNSFLIIGMNASGDCRAIDATHTDTSNATKKPEVKNQKTKRCEIWNYKRNTNETEKKNIFVSLVVNIDTEQQCYYYYYFSLLFTNLRLTIIICNTYFNVRRWTVCICMRYAKLVVGTTCMRNSMTKCHERNHIWTNGI